MWGAPRTAEFARHHTPVASQELPTADHFKLPPNLGKKTDSRAPGFVARHGQLVQVEVEALRPEQLLRLFEDALEPYVDKSVLDAVIEQEDEDIAELRKVA